MKDQTGRKLKAGDLVYYVPGTRISYFKLGIVYKENPSKYQLSLISACVSNPVNYSVKTLRSPTVLKVEESQLDDRLRPIVLELRRRMEERLEQEFGN